MTDRLSLTNALADANIERQKAERIATEIFDAIHDNVATKQDLEHAEAALKIDIATVRTEVSALEQRMLLRFAELEHRLTVRFASVMVGSTGSPRRSSAMRVFLLPGGCIPPSRPSDPRLHGSTARLSLHAVMRIRYRLTQIANQE